MFVERERESFFLSLLLLELHISQRTVYQLPVTLPEFILKIGADFYGIIELLLLLKGVKLWPADQIWLTV